MSGYLRVRKVPTAEDLLLMHQGTIALASLLLLMYLENREEAAVYRIVWHEDCLPQHREKIITKRNMRQGTACLIGPQDLMVI